MNIGQASKASGVSAKMIRYYERVGLVRPPERTGGNYRNFGPAEVSELQFVRRARSLGFSVEEIAAFLSLWRDRGRPGHEVKAVADAHIAELEGRIGELQDVADVLRDLSARCSGDDRPAYPILAKRHAQVIS